MSSRPQRRSAIASELLSADIELALIHIPARVRPPFEALFALDAAMGDVVARSTDPNLGRIKLAWWRERLEELDRASPPAEPRLQAVAEHLIANGISGADLAELEPGWATLLDEHPDHRLVAERGERLFAIGGQLLGGGDPKLAAAGALYALASVGRRGLPQMLEPAHERLDELARHRFPRNVRPLTMLARAAVRDLSRQEVEGARGRAAAMLAHRWSGRIG